MPDFDTMLDSASLERVGDFYRVKLAISEAALASIQPEYLAGYPIQKFTPGSAPLTDGPSGNFAQSIRNAYAYAQTHGGGEVLLPAGVWHMRSTDELVLDGTGAFGGGSVVLRGAPGRSTVLVYPTPYVGEAIRLRGSPPAAGLYYKGGLQDIALFCDAVDAANTGKAIVFDGCIATRVIGVHAQNFTGGTGFYSREFTAGYNSQYVSMYDCTAVGSRVNMDLQAFTNCHLFAVGLNGSSYRELLVDASHVTFFGSTLQSEAPVVVELGGVGGSILTIEDCYFEGASSPTFFKVTTPSATDQYLIAKRFRLNGPMACLLDIEGNSFAHLEAMVGYTNATKTVKSRVAGGYAPRLKLFDCGNPLDSPTKFDLDAPSVGRFTSSDPERIMAGGIDPADLDLTGTLTPFVSEVWDPSVISSRSVISGELDSLTGLLAGTVESAPGSSQRPAFTASDSDVRGNASFTCASAGSGKYLFGTLAHPIVAGSYPALFVIAKTTTGTASERRTAMMLAPAGTGNVANYMRLCLDTVEGPTFAYGFYGVMSLASAVDTNYVPLTQVPHAWLLQQSADGSGLLIEPERGASVSAGPDQGPNAITLERCFLGAADVVAYITAGDLVIYYAAVLKGPLPPSVARRVMSLAAYRFGL